MMGKHSDSAVIGGYCFWIARAGTVMLKARMSGCSRAAVLGASFVVLRFLPEFAHSYNHDEAAYHLQKGQGAVNENVCFQTSAAGR